MNAMTDPLLGPASLELLKRALEDYTVDGVHELLGPDGRAAHLRGDLAGVARALPGDDRIGTLVRLFLLGEQVTETQARAALRPLDLGAARALVAVDGGVARAEVELRPYATDTSGPWWVVSDFGADVRGGPLAPDHVLGIGAASLTLAQATPRRPVARALDLGTGCGVQALHAATHSGRVVATDVSTRALRFAATTAALSGQWWDLREGSLLEPVADERFDLVVANPPFVVSPGLSRGDGGFDYRDSGLSGDAASERLMRGIPGLLTDDGAASLLANWIVPTDGDWEGRLTGWLIDARCDAWIWQREVVEPGAYISLWLRDAGEIPGSPRWQAAYDRWADWFETTGAAGVGMGLVTLWRNDAGPCSVVCEDVVQAVEQPSGAYLPQWLRRRRWLARTDDAALCRARLRAAPGLVRTSDEVLGAIGWEPAALRLRQTTEMRWELDADAAIAALVAGCDGTAPLSLVLDMVSVLSGASSDAVVAAALPVVRDLVGRGFLDVVEL
jgi:methylase of polypeptide subunit release factors